MASIEPWLLENGNIRCLTKETKHGHGRTAHNMSSSSLRKKSDLTLISKVRQGFLRNFLVNLQEVLLGTKLWILFLAIPFAIAAECKNFGRPWVFALSLLGLTPLAERVSFLTEQIAFYTGPTVGGLLNATCGNATELIISIFALVQHKVDVVKYSLLGSILSNLLLVLGSSLFCGGIANLKKEQNFDRKQVDVNALLLLLGLLCHVLTLMFRYAGTATELKLTGTETLALSRATCIVMLIAYISYLVFQLWTHRQLFEASEDEKEDSDLVSNESAIIGFWSAFIWLVLMTGVIALLSEYVVGTIEDASNSWGLSVSFISVILLPIVGNAAEHAGAIIFAFKNKLDITLGVAMGSATQIAIFVIPLSVIMAWIMGIDMNLDFNILETSCLALSIIITTFCLQVTILTHAQILYKHSNEINECVNLSGRNISLPKRTSSSAMLPGYGSLLFHFQNSKKSCRNCQRHNYEIIQCRINESLINGT
ncbi:Vacuolar cation proton exchanger 3 [Olea europaea subsp. europaea]|uniref:Vacuolar cation/proton exchanger n=1 Tax=Olea europaea subsp. europaea TaxID=158383 RepID=A0A8S0QUJ8_OLEEU|nr:Vacuolar cation proton exchanger 3 [Olea europaea subsp. europaea]